MISVLWNLNPDTGGKDIHGTYWMWYRADMFELKRQFKELKRLRKDVGDSYVGMAFGFIWKLISEFFSHGALEFCCSFIICCQDFSISFWHLERNLQK